MLTLRNFGPYFAGNLLSNCGTWFQNIAQSLLVFYDENRFIAAGHRFLRRGREPRLRNFDRARKINLKRGARARIALNFDPTLVLLHDAVNRRESESRALADFFRGEERLEDSIHGD